MEGGRFPDSDARAIEDALRGKVDSLVPDLLAGARIHGAYWQVGSVDGEAGTQMVVNRSGANVGLWTDFTEAEGSDRYSGDMLKLICVVHFGGWSKGKEARGLAMAWARSWLGWDSLDKDRLAKVKREGAARREQAAQDAAVQADKRQRSAWALWSGAVPIAGTPAETYLRGRGVDFDRLGRIPGSLRFLPDCWCAIRKSKHPAMVAAIYHGSDFRAAHRTYLDVSGGKHGPVGVVKVITGADGVTRIFDGARRQGDKKPKSYKLTLGQYAGGCITLWKAGRTAALSAMPDGARVFISEGIEDGLSVAIAKPDLIVVAAVALANMGRVVLPRQAGRLTFIGQNDAIDGKAVEAFERAIAKQQTQAREGGRPPPEIMWPKPQYKDFNDQLMGRVMA